MHQENSAPIHGPAPQAPIQDDRLACSVAEAARRLGLSRMTLYREIAAGRLPAIRIRDRLVIPRVVLEQLVNEAINAATLRTRGGGADAA